MAVLGGLSLSLYALPRALLSTTRTGRIKRHWIGKLKRCAVEGAKVEFWEKPDNYVVGKTEHFFEKMLITTVGGDKITGDDTGIWSFSTFKYRANGWVTGATVRWAYRVAYKVHEMGYTTVVPPPERSTVVKGAGTLWLAP